MERLGLEHRMAQISVEFLRPIPMAGFRVQAEIDRPGRSVTRTRAEILDDDRVYVRARGVHMRTLDDFSSDTASVESPQFDLSVPGPFPIRDMLHDERAFNSSIEARYDPSASIGTGGPTVMWLRSIVPILAGEEPSGFQRICPLADSGNGISYNNYLDEVLFVNPDLVVAIHREPQGEWLCAKAVSHWQPDGTGLADSELFDRSGSVGRALQTVLLDPVTD